MWVWKRTKEIIDSCGHSTRKCLRKRTDREKKARAETRNTFVNRQSWTLNAQVFEETNGQGVES